ncbi:MULTISPECIES: branched-chain amino acid ABC transporter permease [Clostridium]|jgi:branched-chain amino acid transport system permease protein|uniref:Amino acid/amide ABC transporter membrane protein 1, HAAT family n=1 Tax=Clostridium saccharoperbutylacetonicum N1-4(HMT) TaxID=931276 RepID=M1MY75_9CLOT|nr:MULTISPECIES: branched-chain amino acid ABC transporter permease [Clostridium]AGF59481.1 amino acid/amide ABC transporter membrane protein 1, HAAT family [Clostridium saccharoperbutylacetonicum N1-4(HMT)]AQR98169.1 high-affinity branched-chain amino acid transport system permease protein LivH [Clostridium saccharoperbutylacetonicum]NRT59725.1 branched-chain amino acid transport system permease protein [Clostridium saccharoperbutylacetonicum]NSB28918.1 branched-chain amino acid transport syst
MEFIQQIINGLALGSVYALLALGYTMVYGIIQLINFAHGEIYMIGAFSGFYCASTLKLPLIPTLLVAMAVSALAGIIIEKVAYKPLRNSPRIALLITAIGVSLFLQNAMRLLVGSNPKPFPDLINAGSINIGAIQIDMKTILMFGVSALLVVLLQFIVYKTKVGKAMRASSQDMEAASLMGINVDNTISLTFAIGSALAGIAGVLVAISYPSITPYMGAMPGLKAFVAAVLGGIGSIPGALVGGLAIGLLETFSKAYISTNFSDAIVFAILIIILLIKPSGLLGKKTNVKV